MSPPLLTLVSGPHVVFLFERTDKDRNDLSKEYVWTHFDVIRIENGSSRSTGARP